MTRESRVLIGLQYGDEGKARVLDKILSRLRDSRLRLTPKYKNVVARFAGGANAGHTLEKGDKRVVLHQIPSGIFDPDAKLYIASGCVLNPQKTNREITDINNIGISIEKRLHIAANTTLIQPHHLILDAIHGKAIGTTGNGIGHAYADRAQRALGETLKTLRFADYLIDTEAGKDVVRANLEETNAIHNLDLNVNKLTEEFHMETMELEKYLTKNPLFLESLVADYGYDVFYEGAQAVMLDNLTGTVPFVTSSRTLAGAAYTCGDLSSRYHKRTMGVAKAIMSRVGNGPFVSGFAGKESEKYCMADGGNKYKKAEEKRLYDIDTLSKSENPLDLEILLRRWGKEYGASTKRPRRIGALDLVMLKQNCALNDIDELYITKFDCLEHFSRTTLPGIPVVTAYELDGKIINYMPTTTKEAEAAKPIVEYLPHIREDISGATHKDHLPSSVFDVKSFIEAQVRVPIYGIGVGPERDQFVFL
ncbi:adenylosuccinate synthetase [archaeon]|nr:adenylosuccinate synthetase [archaeon]MBT3731186.1 adenylosuccinate synthetase [archaeon]MBT4670060.1 adenylosuccinate synthetase [archaeon]MBT7052547.1 adenylosuccinate synthetase [archaeon]MBT7281707.1 adenylosuccinate synthetase [archaeon]